MAAHKEEEPDPLAAMPPVPAKTTFEAKDPEPYDAGKRLPPVDEDKVEAIGSAGDKERLQTNLRAAGAALIPRRCAAAHAAALAPLECHLRLSSPTYISTVQSPAMAGRVPHFRAF